MAKKGFFQTIKEWLSGGGKSKPTSTSSAKSNVRKASSVSNYGGGYSSTYRPSARRSEDDEREKQRQKLTQQNKQTTAKLAEIAKVSQRTDALSSGKKALPPEPKTLANNGVERAVKKIGEKSGGTMTARTTSLTRENLNTIKADRQERNEAFHAATNHRYDVAEKGISDEERARRRQNIRTAPLGEMMGGREDEAVDVMKAKMKYDKVGESLRRGVANTATAGTIRLAEKRLNQGARKEAEEYYQQNKDKAAEVAGSLLGGMALYGGTAGTFESIGQNLVGRAAGTELGKRLGAETLANTMAGTGLKSVVARSLVGDTIQDSTIGAFDTTMDILSRDDLETPSDYLKAWFGGQALNYGMGLAGNAVAHGAPVLGRAIGNAWDNFADQSRRLYAVPKSVADTVGTAAENVKPKPQMKTVITDSLSDEARLALRVESGRLDNERWEIVESIKDEYGTINPNYKELTPEQRADVVAKKTRLQEITARQNEIIDELRIVRRVEGAPEAEAVARESASVDVPESGRYNNIEEAVDNGTEIRDLEGTRAGGETVSAVDESVSARGRADNEVVEGVANTSSNGRSGSGARNLRVSSKNRKQLTKSGVKDTHLSDVSNNYATFSNALDEAKAANVRGSWVDSQSVDDLAKSNARAYLSDDGYAGVAVKDDGDICGVFKNPASKYRGAVYDLIYTARANGGTKMDCYGAQLVNMYESAGYVPVARIPFNPKYVSDASLLKSRPDVYVLMKNADDLDTVASRIKKSEGIGGYHRSTQKELDNLPTFEDYDEALAYRNKLLDEQESGKIKKPDNAYATEAAGDFRKRRSKLNKALKERYPLIDEVYDANKDGTWVFYKDKTGELCVGNPSAEHGRIRDGYRWKSNGDYYGKLSEENFEKARKAFDEENFEPFVSKSKKGAKAVEPPEAKAKSGVDPLKTYKEKVAAEKAEAKPAEAKVRKAAKPEVDTKVETKPEPPVVKKVQPKGETKLYTVEVKGKDGTRTVEVEAESKKQARYLATQEEGDRSAMIIGERAVEPKPEPKAETKAEPKAETKAEAKVETKPEPPEAKKTGKKQGAKKEAAKKGAKSKEQKVVNEPLSEEQLSSLKEYRQGVFDKDFADFRKKIGDAKSEIYELENKLRAAETKEDKAAIRKQIKALKDSVKKAHQKASLRYHPDKGGSDEWMAKFNEAYESFKNGGKEAKAPTGKNAKPTRTVSNVEDIVNKKRQGASAKEQVEDAVQTIRRKVMNSMVSFEDTNLKTVKTDNEGWKVRNAATDKVRRHRNIANVSIRNEQLGIDGRPYSGTVERIGADGKKYQIENGKSLLKIYDDVGEENEAAFDAYLLLNHAPDRIREGTPIFDRILFDKGDGTPIRSLNDPEFVKEEAERLLREHPDFAQRAEELYQYIRNELENRVRGGLNSQEIASKWAHDHPNYVPTGRDGFFNAINGSHRGVIGADPYKAAKGSDLDIRSIKEQLAEATSRNWRDITTNDLLEKFFGGQITTTKPKTKGFKLLNDTVGLAKSAEGHKYYAKVWRDGKAYYGEIPKRYYDDLIDLNKNGSVGPIMDTVARASSKFSGPFKKLVTTWNPIFLPNNFSRDFQDAIINSRNSKEFAECLGPAMKQLRTNGEFARAFERTGVSQSNLVNLDETLKGERGALGKAVNKFIALQDMTESLPRLAEFMGTLKAAGVNIKDPEALKNVDPRLIDQAAANASDVTVNFGRSGSVSKNLNKGLVPFFTPSLQGSSKFVRNFTEQKGLKELLGMLGRATVLGAGTVALNNFMLSDNPNYKYISARDKALNIIIQWPPFDDDTDLFVKIPRGRFAVVYGLATLNMGNENKMGWAEMLKVSRDQVLPVDPTESSLYAPLYHAKNNKTWYGAPIESDFLVENYEPSERYDSSTTPIGKGLGKLTSGLPESMQISPKKADYLIDSATGVAGDFLMPMSTSIARGDNPLKTGANVLKKAFTIDTATRNNLSTRYYDQEEKLKHKMNSAKATEADEKAYEKFSSWDNRIKSITKAMRYIQDSDMPNKEDAYRQLAKLRNEDMQKALDGKRSISNAKDIDVIHKYAGTSYTIENLGKSADQKALKAYGAAVYGNLSDSEMRKKIDADTEFYKGYEGIVKTQNALQKVDTRLKGSNALTYAVGLADAGANDNVFAAYDTTIKSRTETASKAQRAKDYLKNNGSVEEFAQLENAVKNLGKLSDVDKGKLEDEAYAKLKSGKITIDEYNTELDKIAYNANQSNVGKAVSLAMSGAPARAYNLYDINAKNVQKGYNLAAMGIDSRKYRELSQACDKDGNGYLKTAEIRDFVAKSGYEDKATLFDALCYYDNVRNPFGTPKKYSSANAAAAGERNGTTQIKANAGADNTVFAESKSSGSSYGGYGGYGGYYHYGHRGGSSKKAKVPTPKKMGKLVGGEALVSKSSKSRAKAQVPTLARVEAKIDLPTAKYSKQKRG